MRASEIRLDQEQRVRASVLLEAMLADPEPYAFELIYLRDALAAVREVPSAEEVSRGERTE